LSKGKWFKEGVLLETVKGLENPKKEDESPGLPFGGEEPWKEESQNRKPFPTGRLQNLCFLK